ncbi:MAG: DNA-3-methyladenine glycosylase, partial [Anaerolineales bacterium]
MKILPQSFYSRPTLTVAHDLLGSRLVSILDGVRLAGIIIEAEAYVGQDDLGCHAKAGKTHRNAVMFGPPGYAYVYFTYGQHWMLNAVTEKESFPAAVLIRAIDPVEGADVISLRRHGRDTIGPAKLTMALGISGGLNGVSLFDPGSGLWIEEGSPVSAGDIITSPRVGLFTVPEPWKSI